jgi:asparagine synthase (glutamine-hydrolysing)
VAGYQPYERLGLWLRRQLRPMVERILLSERCRQRGLLHPDTLEMVVADHTDNRRNHTFLLLALMVIELGQRMFVDGSFANWLRKRGCGVGV